LYMAPYIPVIRKHSKAIISLRAHNVENEIWKRLYLRTKNPFKKLYLKILATRMTRFENEALNSYDLLIPISEKDNSYFQKHGNLKPSLVIPVGIPETYFFKIYQSEFPTSIFFIGALDWEPNLEGLVWFIDTVWNKLRTYKPNVTFNLAGRNAPNWFVKKCMENGINYHGEVEDARAFFDKQQIMIVPLFAGSGLRVKIIEAMARSKVVVTTPVGAEGLVVENGKHLIIADTSQIFLKSIEELLENKEYYSELGANAFLLAEQAYNNNLIANSLIHFYLQFIHA
jgi:polysaccharide biosynthesis protein PslH